MSYYADRYTESFSGEDGYPYEEKGNVILIR